MDLRDGERVIFQGHPSWRSVLGFYLQGLLFTALAAGVAALVTVIAAGFSMGTVIASAVSPVNSDHAMTMAVRKARGP